MSKHKRALNISLSGIFISLGIVLPFLTGQIPEIGSMLCPMHIPVLICGFICGWKYGLIVGFATPLLRSAIFQMPPMYPTAIAMSFELGAYGLIAGILYNIIQNKCKSLILGNYITLIIAMLLGRIVWGIAYFVMALLDGTLVFTFEIFITAAFVSAWPGIVLQLLLIPFLITALDKVLNLKEK